MKFPKMNDINTLMCLLALYLQININFSHTLNENTAPYSEETNINSKNKITKRNTQNLFMKELPKQSGHDFSHINHAPFIPSGTEHFGRKLRGNHNSSQFPTRKKEPVLVSEREPLFHVIMKRNSRRSNARRNDFRNGTGHSLQMYDGIYQQSLQAQLKRANISVQESDIAAIFRNVAYGPTESALMQQFFTPPYASPLGPALRLSETPLELRPRLPPETNPEKNSEFDDLMTSENLNFHPRPPQPSPSIKRDEEENKFHLTLPGTKRVLSGKQNGGLTYRKIIGKEISPTEMTDAAYNFPDIGFPTTIRILIPPKIKSDTDIHNTSFGKTTSNRKVHSILESVKSTTSAAEAVTTTVNRFHSILYNQPVPSFDVTTFSSDVIHTENTGNDHSVRRGKIFQFETPFNVFSTKEYSRTTTTTTTIPEDIIRDTMFNVTEYPLAWGNISVFGIEISFTYTWQDLLEIIDENRSYIWRIHVYTVTSVFGLISTISLYRLLCRCKSLPFLLHSSFYLVMFASSLARALIVLWDPYKKERILPELVLRVLYITGEPCVGVVMSSFIVLLLNIFYGMIVVPTIIALFSGMEMATGLFVELAFKYFTFDPGNISQIFLEKMSFIIGMIWNGVICLSYIILLSSQKLCGNTNGAQNKNQKDNKDLEKGNRCSNSVHPGDGNGIWCYCFIATFAQLFMVAMYVYILLHPKQLLIRPDKLEEKWMLFQVLARILEFVVYGFLLISADRVSRNFKKPSPGQQVQSKQSCCLRFCYCSRCCCCCRHETGEKIKVKRNRKQKMPLHIYTLNEENDADHFPTDDFQLVWSRDMNNRRFTAENTKKPRHHDNVKNKRNGEKSKSNGKTKKLKTVRERNELLQSVKVDKTTQNKVVSSPAPKPRPHSLCEPDIEKLDNELALKKIDIHGPQIRNQHTYESFKDRKEIQRIIDLKLPHVDKSIYKYMGVTVPHSINYPIYNNRKKDSFITTPPETVTKRVSCHKDENKSLPPKIPTLFWSPQHKSSSKPFSVLPPLPIKAEAPLNLPSLPPLNPGLVTPPKLPPLKLNLAATPKSPEKCDSGNEDESNEAVVYEIPRTVTDIAISSRIGASRRLNSVSGSLNTVAAAAVTGVYATPCREFINDFMSSHPTPFSARFSSADLTTISSYSEMRVDYLTDLSSADGNSLGSRSHFRSSRMSVSNLSDQLNYC